MQTLACFDFEIRKRTRTKKAIGVRALVRAADASGPFGVVIYATLGTQIDESRSPEVLPGAWDDFGEACEYARASLVARGRAGS